MPVPRLNQRRAFVIVLVVLVLTSLLPARWALGLSSRPRWLVLALMTPATHLLHSISTTLRRPAFDRVALAPDEQLQRHYEAALARNERLEQELMQAQRRIEELAAIRQHLSLGGFQLVDATVVGWAGDPEDRRIRINRGGRHGLREQLVVVTSANVGSSLVGRVTDATPLSSTVELITAPRTRLDVRIRPTVISDAGPTTAVSVQLERSTDGESFLAIVERGLPIEVGYLAHLADDTWPSEARGWIVGQVVALERNPQNPTLEDIVYVRPTAPLAYLSRVNVLVPQGG